MKILDKHWFTNRDGTIGIVKADSDYDGIKYYISHVLGFDEVADSEYITKWGSTFPKEAGDALFGLT
jgi:hypothetical protein